jgi:hypothetical protein
VSSSVLVLIIKNNAPAAKFADDDDDDVDVMMWLKDFVLCIFLLSLMHFVQTMGRYYCISYCIN